MAKIQCKMCGGLNELPDGVTSGECPYCGSLTTFPKITDTQTEQLYSRAEHFRRNNNFDKAVSTYESILNRNNEDPEAYWGLLISRYGIEYVEDPATHERIPTCHRVQFDSILADSDYLNALKFSSGNDRGIYEKEAQRIADIQKSILKISAQEKPYDVFICYKETTEGGTRTKDSALAQDIYYQLTKQGLKAFFSRITLENKLGTQYEPYIFAALNSAKVMLVIGTKREYFEAVWVKNEWSRFLSLMKKDSSKLLIPCFKDMDAYDIPEELSMFQCEDMGKIGFMQDILHGIMKVVNAGKQAAQSAASSAASPSGAVAESAKLMKRISVLLEQQDWQKAQEICDKCLNLDPENPKLYLMMCMVTRHIPNEEALRNCREDLASDKNLRTAIKFASGEFRKQLEEILQDNRINSLLKKCMETNRVSDLSQLSRSNAPLNSDANFQSALKFASPERKKELLQIQYDQAVYFIEGFLKKHNVSDLRQINVPLDSEPEFHQILSLASPEHREELENIQRQQCNFFLGKCMEANRVSTEADLAQTDKPLIEDNYFKTALRCAAPEQKKELLQIQSKQTDYFLERCIRDKGVSSPEQLPEPITLNNWFNKALENALEQKKALKQIPSRQIQYFLDKCLLRHGVGNIDDLVRCKTNLADDPDFQMARRCCVAAMESFEEGNSHQLSANRQLQKLDEILFKQMIERRKPLIYRTVAAIIIVIACICIYLCRYYIAAGLGSSWGAVHLAEQCKREGDPAGALKWYAKAAKHGHAEAQCILALAYYKGENIEKNYDEAAKWFRKAAEQGNAEAQKGLGRCFDNGEGVPQDYEEAVKWYRKAADQGHAGGQNNLGVCYEYGHGVTKDVDEAVKWYRKAADQHEPVAQCNLGKCYLDGIGVTKDSPEAVRWFRKAAEQGNSYGQFELARCYFLGDGVTKDISEAMQWCRKAADQGNPEAQHSLGACYANGDGVTRDDAMAVQWFRFAAEQGNPFSQHALGLHYEDGKGVAKNISEAIKWYRKAAEQGLDTAQARLGLLYFKGDEVPQDFSEAAKWFRKAAEQEDADPAVQAMIGTMYRSGVGVDKDLSEAVKWFRKAAEQDTDTAQCILGNCYYNGEGVTKDFSEAVKWYRKAAEQDNADAQYGLGNCYYNGEGVTKDFSEAVKWYRKAAEQDNADAQYKLSVCYYNGDGVGKDLAEAAKWFQKATLQGNAEAIKRCQAAAEQGHAESQYILGKCYLNGRGVTKNLAEAVKWFRKAAEQGNAGAQYELGNCYEFGNGVTKDLSEAAKWYRYAADQGFDRAQFSLGYCYENGNGVTKNYYEAVKWYRNAAEQGNAGAQNNLGTSYYSGNGVTKDYYEAAKWFRKAAEQGDSYAQSNLGICYENGNGVTKDLAEAVKWYRKAAEQGNEDAKKSLERLGK